MVFHIIFIISMFEEIKNKKNMEIKMGGKLKKNIIIILQSMK